LASRLKRLLTISDFTPCPVNRLAYAAVGEVSVVDEYERDLDEQVKKAQRLLRSRREQERQLPFDFWNDDDGRSGLGLHLVAVMSRRTPGPTGIRGNHFKCPVPMFPLPHTPNSQFWTDRCLVPPGAEYCDKTTLVISPLSICEDVEEESCHQSMMTGLLR
jgi:hypothetical protein